MNETELLELWQSSEADAPVAFTGRELAHHAPKHRAEGARLPPASSEGATYLAAALEAHRSASLRRLRLVEFVAAGRALERLRDLMGWSKQKSSWLPVLGLAGVAVSLVAVVMGVWLQTSRPPVLPPPPAPAALPVAEFVEECLSSASAASTDPQWAQAELNCRRALALEPSNAEVAAKAARIPVMRGCANRYAAAVDDIERGALEHAFATLETIDRTCEAYLFKAMSLAAQHVGAVTRGLAEDCQRAVTDGAWPRAMQRCEAWARLACQSPRHDLLYPPAGLTLGLSGPLTDWRPNDRVYVDFLKARSVVLPDAEMWQCPQLPLFQPRFYGPPPDPADEAIRELKKRYSEPAFGLALASYFKGDFAGAPVPLKQVEEQMAKAAFHAQAKALRADIERAVALYAEGTDDLSKGQLERAESPFVEALAVDARLMLGDAFATLDPEQRRHELGRRESFLRRSIENVMSSKAYEQGVALSDRRDFRAACSKWKLGARFSRANIDLLKALTNVCTRSAAAAFDRAQTCDELKRVRDFAVDGDGFGQKVDESLVEQGCAP